MTDRLSGQWALVTGGGRGIGRAIAVALAREGCSVALAARSRDELEATAALCREAGAKETSVHILDLADGPATDALAAELIDRHGGIDVLINNAGVFAAGNAVEGDPDEWAWMMAVDALAPMRLIRRLAPGMVERERGTIVSIGSVAGIEPMKVTGAYAAAKHALRGFSLSSYERLREHGIKVVVIHPAYVRTEMTAGVPGAIPERMLSPDDVAEAAMLAVRTSAACCPQEITLRLTKRAG